MKYKNTSKEEVQIRALEVMKEIYTYRENDFIARLENLYLSYWTFWYEMKFSEILGEKHRIKKYLNNLVDFEKEINICEQKYENFCKRYKVLENYIKSAFFLLCTFEE